MLLQILRRRRVKKTIPATLAGLRVIPSARAKRMNLRVEEKTGDVVFTWPTRARGLTREKALRFITENREWIAQRKAEAVPQKDFAPGDIITVAGEHYTIVRARGRGLTRFEGHRLIVHGEAEHVSRRVRDFLKAHAAVILTRLANRKARMLDLPPSPIRILDPKTRWGSCDADGRIMFSWRLIFAPVEVMDYIVAHEVAHRIHLNHSRRFWKLCAELTPDSVGARDWLRVNGRQLMRWK